MKILLTAFILFISLKSMSQDNTTAADWAQLKKYAGQNKNLRPAAKGEKRVVFMGNSITEFWRSDKTFFSDLYINRGISGQTTAQMLRRFQQDVINLKPAIVVILGGINDIAQNQGPVLLEQTFANIQAMAELAKKNKIKVILCSVLPAFDFHWRRGLQPAPKIIALNAMIKAYCSRHNLPFVDYYTPMADKRGGLKAELTEDGVHPNVAGYKVMEPIVLSAIKKALAKK